MQKYVDLFISRLSDEIHSTHIRVINVVKWFNYLTTDIIGELTFGESFGGLEENRMHPWLENLFWCLKTFSFFRELSRYPRVIAYAVIALIVPKRQLKHQRNATVFGAEKARRRMKRGTERSDFMSYILRHNDERGSVPEDLTIDKYKSDLLSRMSENEIATSSITLIVAGSETSQSPDRTLSMLSKYFNDQGQQRPL